MAITVEGVPESITWDQLGEWLAQIGIEANLVRSITIDRNGIRAVIVALDERGQRYVRGDEMATHEVQILLKDDPARPLKASLVDA